MRKGGMKKRRSFRFYASLLYLLLFAVIAFLFFTNDFNILDLRKTSVIIGVGIDVEEDDVVLTAQLAVPQPAENGENTLFNVVTGRGGTVAEALNEINVKTGFYPKMVFCKLVLIGESCFGEDLTALLDYFYRNEFTGLALNIAACKGEASELISRQFPCGNSATDVIDKLLSDEAQASGNVATNTLKGIGESLFSESASAYMPYLVDPSLEESGGGEGGGGSGGSGGGGGGGSGGKSQQCEESELVCDKCAVFSNGYFKTVISAEESFILNIINNSVRHAFIACGEEGDEHVLGLRSCKAKTDLSIEDGAPVLKFEMKATAKIQDSMHSFTPEQLVDNRVPREILAEGENEVAERFLRLVENLKEADCDVLGLRSSLYKKYYKDFAKYSENLLKNVRVECKVKIKSSS